MNPFLELALQQNRRRFFGRSATGLGTLALGSLLAGDLSAAKEPKRNSIRGLADLPHFPPQAKRVIWLFQSGGPSQLDLYDPKPELRKRFGQDVPTSVYPDERKTTMTAGQKQFVTAPSIFNFRKHGESGVELTELLPNLGTVADELCLSLIHI